MIQHGQKFSEKRIFIEDKTIRFESGYSIKIFYTYCFMAFSSLICMAYLYFSYIYGSRNNSAAMIIFWILFTIYVMETSLRPIIEMLFRHRIYLNYDNNQLLTESVFGKKNTRYFRNKRNTIFERKLYFHYKTFHHKIVFKNDDISISVCDHIDSKKEARSLCDFLQNFNDTIDGTLANRQAHSLPTPKGLYKNFGKRQLQILKSCTIIIFALIILLVTR